MGDLSVSGESVEEDEDRKKGEMFKDLMKRTWLVERNFDARYLNAPRTRWPHDTPAHVAVFENNISMLKWLATRGVIFSVTNDLGDNPLQNACASVKPAVAAFVLRRLADERDGKGER